MPIRPTGSGTCSTNCPTRFHRWELIAAAQHYGADAASLQELHTLPDGRYWSLSDVINTVAERRGHRSPHR